MPNRSSVIAEVDAAKLRSRVAARGRPVAAFPIHIRGLEGDFRADERAHVRRKLERRLNKFAESIERVSLRTEDVNGPRGGVDRVCRIKVVIRGLPTIVFEAQDAFLNAAVDLALAGVERAVRRAVQRRRMKPLRRTN
jgi:ribosome-associated translation inhibitor RaiA